MTTYTIVILLYGVLVLASIAGLALIRRKKLKIFNLFLIETLFGLALVGYTIQSLFTPLQNRILSVPAVIPLGLLLLMIVGTCIWFRVSRKTKKQ